MEKRNIEQNKIRQVARNYEKKGYKVVIEPHGKDIPAFIQNFHPDIIATSEKDNVVVEIKTRTDFSTIEQLKDIADIVNKRENWRFELIVTTSMQEINSENERINIDLEISEIKKNIKEVKKLSNQGLFASAFILCWANLESLSRQLLVEDKKNIINKTPLVLIKTLFSFGYLTRTDYENLEKLFQLRNLIVHGYKTPRLDNKSINKLILIIDKLLVENESI